ncbi:MAG TPA: response regulator transcription factor [Candidatus Krumholzibacteria bacterium]|nr:response regulator transcription factor [Candidatus Krumholzibacteria bacterium]
MRVLVVEDNAKMAEAIRKGLAQHGYVVDVSRMGFDAEEDAAARPYDVIILDLMLPDRDGIDVCRGLRRRGVATPILMLTALADTETKIAGLDAGADDYLTKPFEFEELVARVRALLRRGQATESARLTYADLECDLVQHSILRAGRTIRLSAKEFALLEYLMRNADRVLTRQSIMEKVWAEDGQPGSNVIDVHISSLRRKLDRDSDTSLIHTVIGVGYRFGTVVDEASA